MAKHRKFGAGLQKRGGKGSKSIKLPAGQEAPPRVESPKPATKPLRAAVPGSRRSLRLDAYWVLPALLLGVAVYINTLDGAFVYDDQRQIVRNTLIQDDSQIWRALTSDVWAFKGGEQAVSNYWRPSFVLWMMLHFRWFGLETFGWHLTNVMLHLAVVLMAFSLLRRLDLSRQVAGAIALIFAVHPVHTESVAWISGSPDLILCLALLGSMWFVKSLGGKRTPLRWALAMLLYLVALGAKEIAILFPVVVVATLWHRKADSGEKGVSWSRSLSIAWPFAAAAVVYLLIRQSILGSAAHYPEGSAGFDGTILTAPAIFTFYLRQIVFPYWIGPSYPLRTVTAASIGITNFVVPLIIVAGAGWFLARMAAGSRVARIGLALFIVPLLPTMNIAAFHPEQLVHDRYLYVPLFGFLMLTIPALARLAEYIWRERKESRRWLVYAGAVLICVPLAVQTVRYNRAWLSNLALWEWGVRSDPNSAFNYLQYGIYLQEAKRLDEAMAAFNRSLQIKPQPNAYVARAATETERRQFTEAERDLREVISKPDGEINQYTMYQAYEGLAVCFTRQQQLNEAATTLAEGRKRLPIYAGALTEKLAVVLYQGGQKQEALNQLNSVRAQARTETLPESRLVFYRIGLLNVELGQPQAARAAFQEFLTLTRDTLTPDIQKARTQVEVALGNLSR